MNRFEATFFRRYVDPNDEIEDVFHRHIFVTLFDVLLWMIGGALLPAWVYKIVFFEDSLLWFDLPFWVLGTYLIIIWFVLMLKIFDWYNDVWIITHRGIAHLDWSPWVKNIVFTEYDDITGIESNEKNWFDSIFHVGDIILHKVGADMRITRVAHPASAVATITRMQHARDASKKPSASPNMMHIYFDGVKQQVHVGKDGNLHTHGPVDDAEEQFIENTRQKRGTIDLVQKRSSKT